MYSFFAALVKGATYILRRMVHSNVWLFLEAISLLMLSVASAELGPYVPITIVHSAVAKGAGAIFH